MVRMTIFRVPFLLTMNCILLFCVTCLASAIAQEDEPSEAITVFSDSSVVRGLSSGNVRVIFYRGNVRIIQGLIEISGDEATVTVSSNPSRIMSALVKGNPVYFEESSVNGEANTTGSSETIEYDVVEGQIVFDGGVELDQPGVAYRCGSLFYNLSTKLASGTEGCQVTLAN